MVPVVRFRAVQDLPNFIRNKGGVALRHSTNSLKHSMVCDDRNGECETVQFHAALSAIWTTPFETLAEVHHPIQYLSATHAFLLWSGMDQRGMLSNSESSDVCPPCLSSPLHRHNNLSWYPKRHQEHVHRHYDAFLICSITWWSEKLLRLAFQQALVAAPELDHLIQQTSKTHPCKSFTLRPRQH